MANDINSNTTNDIGITEKTYSTSEVAKLIGIAPVTARKYSQLLEEKGYVFIRSKVKSRQKARLYRYKDIETLRYLTNIRKEGRITVSDATSITIERLGKGAIQDIASTDIESTDELRQSNKQYKELIEIMAKQADKHSEEIKNQNELLVNQSKLLQNLTERIEKQEKYLSQPTENKQIEAPKKGDVEEPIKEEKTKKGFFSKLVNKFLIDTRDNE